MVLWGNTYHKDQGGNNVIHDFWYLGEGEMKMTRYQNVIVYTLTYLRSVLISNNNTVIPCVFLPFLAENYESYLIYVK